MGFGFGLFLVPVGALGFDLGLVPVGALDLGNGEEERDFLLALVVFGAFGVFSSSLTDSESLSLSLSESSSWKETFLLRPLRFRDFGG